MIETSIILTIVPPIVTGAFAYFIARKRNTISEKISKAKVNAEIQTQALTIVRGVMNDMRDELRREITQLKEENTRLRKKVEDNVDEVKKLHDKLSDNNELIETLKSEIHALRTTIKVYEDEINRLKNQ